MIISMSEQTLLPTGNSSNAKLDRARIGTTVTVSGYSRIGRTETQNLAKQEVDLAAVAREALQMLRASLSATIRIVDQIREARRSSAMRASFIRSWSIW
jgi:hypothetical protein